MRSERVGDAVHEGLLGAHDDEVGSDLLGDTDDSGGIVGVDGDAPLPHRRDTGIAGSGHDVVDRGRVVERPRQRVGPPVRAEDEDAHRRFYAARGSTTVCSRPGPTDTKVTGTPVNSSMKRT